MSEDEHDQKCLAEDSAMALHIQEKCKFTELIDLASAARRRASSEEALQTYTALIAHLSDAKSDIDFLVRITNDAAHDKPSSRDLGEVCSKKKMGAVG